MQGHTDGGRVGRNAPPASGIYWCYAPLLWNLVIQRSSVFWWSSMIVKYKILILRNFSDLSTRKKMIAKYSNYVFIYLVFFFILQ
jgi:hypothetical protein